MKQVSDFQNFLRRAALAGVVVCTLVSLLTSTAVAKPIMYTIWTVTDGSLGTWSFHNARVYLTFRSDTNYVQFFQPLIDPNDPTVGTVDTYVNEVGTAQVTIISGKKVARATLLPNQVFVSLDLGDTVDAPHVGGRGLGFSSFSATGIEPVYPLGIEDGTLDWGDILGVASAPLQALPVDLVHTTAFSGRGWPCTGFPNHCGTPTPLHSNKGDLLLSIPYTTVDPAFPTDRGDSMSAAFFVATLGGTGSPTPALPPTPIALAAKPISYHGYTLADVTLGARHYTAAQVYLSVDADAATAVPFNNGTSYGFVNLAGNAHVAIVKGGLTTSANFDPGQIYVYYDLAHASIGFGSTAGGSAYPFSITAHQDSGNFESGVVEDSSVGAVADITLTPTDIQFYTPQTATLATDLTNPTTLSGGVSSCVAFDPTNSVCSNLTPVALTTSRGDFYMFEPYTEDETPNGDVGPYTINWGVFWSEMGPKQH